MRIVVGLGNPGREYAATRHNLGFMVVDELVRRVHAPPPRKRFRSEISESVWEGQRLILVKPQTYMNLSGHAVREVMHWYHAAPGDLLVVLDELDLPFGTTRLRGEGSAGGHNGLASVLEQLGSRAIPRLRVGIGRGSSNATTQVLSRFTLEEEREVAAVIQAAAGCVALWLTDGLTPAMNQCNRREGA